MRDITDKIVTLRFAKARAQLRVSLDATAAAIANNTVPKGRVYDMAKAAALLAIKRTSDTIPDCHPIPVEFATVDFELENRILTIDVSVKTIYKTGVEVEAMYGASVAAITAYDMLKPLDDDIEVVSIKLLEKTGGKTQYQELLKKRPRSAVVVCSDTVSAGKKEDRAGRAICAELDALQVPVEVFKIIPDDPEQIRACVEQFHRAGIRLLIFSGGTGLSARDQTPETIRPLLTREIPGIAEAIRAYGQQRTPYAMLSRSVAGYYGEMLMLALPGSTNGARESMKAIFPFLLHVFYADNHEN